MIKHSDFSFETRCKGMTFGSYKIKNNSNYIIFYNGQFIGEVGCKRDAIEFIDNLVEHQKLTYTA